MKRKVDAYMIAIMAMLIALMVVLSQVFGFEIQLLKITFSFVPEVVMATLFGPFWTGVGAVIADVIGNTLLAKAPFFIGFTFNAFLGGLIYGFFFYKKEITLKNSLMCVIVNTVVFSFCLTPLWLSLMYGIDLTNPGLWTTRLIKAAIMIPIETMIIYIVGRALPYRRLAKRLHSN